MPVIHYLRHIQKVVVNRFILWYLTDSKRSVPSDSNICTFFLCCRKKHFYLPFMEYVIIIRHRNPLPCGYFQPSISGIPVSAIFLVYHMYPAVILGIPVTYGAACIRGTVINQDDFQVPVALVHDAVHTFPQIFFRVIYRYDYTHQIFH